MTKESRSIQKKNRRRKRVAKRRKYIVSLAGLIGVSTGAINGLPWGSYGNLFLTSAQAANYNNWFAGDPYIAGDTVAYNGRVYLALQDSTGVTPGTNGAFWQLENQGATGATGPTGSTGLTGSTGPSG